MGDRVFEAVAPFSGGEKARLVLALLVRHGPNLLLLDEPTNHLDLEMRHALSTALQAFDGAVVLISHDRHLLRVCCDKLLLVAQNRAQVYEEDLDTYARWLLQERKNANDSTAVQQNKPDKKEQRREQALARQKLQPLKNKLKQIERQLEASQTRLAAIETTLAQPEIYESAQAAELKSALSDQVVAKKELEEIELQWMDVADQIETASQTSE